MSDQQRQLFRPRAGSVGVGRRRTTACGDRLLLPSRRLARTITPFRTHCKPDVEPGRRVRVPIGRGNRLLVGYCTEVGTRATVGRRLKPIRAVVDAQPLLSHKMLRLAHWISDYYLCEVGQALEAVVPAGVRERAGTREQVFLSVPIAVVARLTQLQLPKKQATALRMLAASTTPMTPAQLAAAAGCTQSPIQELRKKGLVNEEVKRVQHLEVAEAEVEREQHLELNVDQQRALQAILDGLKAGGQRTILLHGITGSGKTEVYIRAIDEVIRYGKQAIVLVPEISLTPQTRARFRRRFDSIAVLHSHLSASERHWHWQQIARGEVQVVVGARSAIFAPTPQLGLVVMDEEHDSSFKQDTAPRYHARDVALQRTRDEGVPLVLGSATPALESWQAAQTGRYELVEMPRRVMNRPLPDVATIDLRVEFQSRSSRGAISRPLHQAIDQTLKEGGQVILLLNRRGYSTQIQCPKCGHVIKCEDCDIALTHHRDDDTTRCHYCDYQSTPPVACPKCTFDGIRYGGLGTQKLEAEVAGRFPDVEVLRMDSDTMRKPGSHEQALARFRAGDAKILLGTQMIAKGLDFPAVTLVGVINADTALHFPDFRAAERTFQLVAQVAGRTGRGDQGGRVLVQTFTPEHPAIEAAKQHDYHAFVEGELPLREQFGYSPFSSMIRFVIRGEVEERTAAFASHVVDLLQVRRGLQDCRLLGPAPCPIAKLRGRYRFHVLVIGSQLDMMRDAVREVTGELQAPDSVQWIVDVDPLDLL